MGSNYTPPVTPHLGLPLPSPDAPSQREDIARITAALTGSDAHAAAMDGRLTAVDSWLSAVDAALTAVDGRFSSVDEDLAAMAEQVAIRAVADLSNVPPAAFKAASVAAGVGQPLILTPVVTAPAGEAVGVSRQPVIAVTPYRSLYGVSHAASRVQLSTSADFAAPVVDVTLGAVSTHTVAAVLAEAQRHYVRWRYQDADGVWSDWSGTVSFTTVATSVATPAITSPLNGATGVGKRPTFACSAFAMSSGTDSHTASRWQVSTVSTFATTVIDTGENGTSKTTFTPAADLAGGVQHFVRVQHKGALGKWSAWSSAVSFTTLTFSQWMMIWGAGAQWANDEKILDVAADATGNIYAVGMNAASYLTMRYAYIVSFTSDGAVRWEYNYPPESIDHNVRFWRIAFDDSGNVIVAGAMTTSTTYYLLLTKWSPSGVLLAQKIYNEVRIVHIRGLRRDSSGNLYVLGISEAEGGRSFIGKFNANFDCLWMKSFNDNGTVLHGIVIDQNRNIYASGYVRNHGFVVKIDSSGTVLSQLLMSQPSTSHMYFLTMSMSASGKILIGGEFFDGSVVRACVLDLSPSMVINGQYYSSYPGNSCVYRIIHVGATDNIWLAGYLGGNGGDGFIRYGLSGGVSRVLSHATKFEEMACITVDVNGNPIFGGMLYENTDWPSSYYGRPMIGTMAATGGTTGPLPGATTYSWTNTATDFVSSNLFSFASVNLPVSTLGTGTATRSVVPEAHSRPKTLIPY